MADNTHILKVTEPDEQREVDFELDWLATLTEAQRFELMLERSRLLQQMLVQHGHREAPAIIRRT